MNCVEEELLLLISGLNEEKENYKCYEVLRIEAAIKAEDAKNKVHRLEQQIKEFIGLGRLPGIRD